MALKNLNNTHLSEEQKAASKQALQELETALAVLEINLTAEDRVKYGRVKQIVY